MFEFLFKKREQETARDVELNKVYEELKVNEKRRSKWIRIIWY